MLEPFFLSLVLFFTAYVGILFWAHLGQQKHADRLTEYFLAGRGLGILAAVATLGATEIGLITIAYNAQKGFNTGFAAFHIGVAALAGCLFVGLTGFIVTPLRKTGVLTIPEYYEQRFGRDVRVIGAIVMALGGILNMGLFLKVASLFIVAMLVPLGADMPVTTVMIGLIGLAVLYTALGGMRTVVITDIVQFVLLSAGLVIALAYAAYIVPPQSAVEVVADRMGTAGFNPLEEKTFGLSYVLWMIFVAGIVSAAVWPTALTRALLIKDEQNVSKAYLLASLIFAGRMILPAALGVLAFVYFAQDGASLKPQLVERFGSDADLAATPAFLGFMLPTWLLAAIIVAMFASFMSTQDSYLFCWSSILARDVYAVITNRPDDASAQILATRIGIVLIALYELYWGLAYTGTEDVWDYLAVSGSIYFCSGVVLLAGGLYWKRATRWGAISALACGFLALLGLGPIQHALGLENVSAPLVGFTTVTTCAVAFVGFSLLEYRLTGKTETP